MTTPERYNSTEVLCTYLETKNITLYAHGPVGTEPIGRNLMHHGSKTMVAYCKPWHWANITTEYAHHTHILVLRDPVEQHKHASFLHAMSMFTCTGFDPRTSRTAASGVAISAKRFTS